MSNPDESLTLAFRETGNLCRPPEEPETGRTIVRLVQSIIPVGCTAERGGDNHIFIVVPGSDAGARIAQAVRCRLEDLSFQGQKIHFKEVRSVGNGEEAGEF